MLLRLLVSRRNWKVVGEVWRSWVVDTNRVTKDGVLWVDQAELQLVMTSIAAG